MNKRQIQSLKNRTGGRCEHQTPGWEYDYTSRFAREIPNNGTPANQKFDTSQKRFTSFGINCRRLSKHFSKMLTRLTLVKRAQGIRQKDQLL